MCSWYNYDDHYNKNCFLYQGFIFAYLPLFLENYSIFSLGVFLAHFRVSYLREPYNVLIPKYYALTSSFEEETNHELTSMLLF